MSGMKLAKHIVRTTLNHELRRGQNAPGDWIYSKQLFIILLFSSECLWN